MRVRFGKLTLAVPYEVRNKKAHVLCRCECGREIWVRTDKLTEKRISCGCVSPPMVGKISPEKRREISRLGAAATNAVLAARRAGAERTDWSWGKRKLIPENLRQTYESWRCMLWRCGPTASPRHKRWYAHVSVCERWRDNFHAFLEDVGPRPSKAHSLDRFPDNGGNYEPGNVRWATSIEQNRNRRPRTPRILVDYQGRRVGVGELCALTGLTEHCVRERISKGWDGDRIAATPVRTWPSGRPGPKRRAA